MTTVTMLQLEARRRQYRQRAAAAAPDRTPPRPLPEPVDCCACKRTFRPGADWLAEHDGRTCAECAAPVDALGLLAAAEADGRVDVARSDVQYRAARRRAASRRAPLDDDDE